MDKDHIITATVSVVLAIIGVAILATLVSNQAQTGKVLTAGGGAINRILCAAMSPITGGNCGNLSEVVTSVFNPL